MRIMAEGCWEETLLGMQEVGLNFLLQCLKVMLLLLLLYKSSVSLSHQRLLLLVAMSTWWPLRMTNPAVSDKFHSKLLLDVTAACLASVASNVNASTASWSYLVVSLFQRRGTLNH